MSHDLPAHLGMTHSFMRSIAEQERAEGVNGATDRLVLQDWLKQQDYWNGTSCMYCVARWPYLLAPRLNFADYREELGDKDWAEFIRLQVQTYYWPKTYSGAGLLETFNREQRLYVLGQRGSIEHPRDRQSLAVTARLQELLSSKQPANEFISGQPMSDTWTPAALAWSCSTKYLAGTSDLVFRGGFPERVTTNDYNWSRHRAYVVANCPLKEVYFRQRRMGPTNRGYDVQRAQPEAADEARKLAWPDYEKEI